jgi:type III pantothenate kinase
MRSASKSSNAAERQISTGISTIGNWEKHMILCLDIGNSQIFGGVFDSTEKLQFTFRHNTAHGNTSDQYGIFLKNVLRENNVEPSLVKQIAIASVVPNVDYSITAACRKYFAIDPFVLQSGVKTGIKIKYTNPLEVGADLIAEAIAAVNLYPQQNIIVADFGTATTICPISAQKEYLGGIIIPGLRLAMESLQSNTAKLPQVSIVKPAKVLGNSTIESIQAGLYYEQLATVREVVRLLSLQIFAGKKPIIIGTGGFSHLFADEGIFDFIVPNIVLDGLLLALKMNL